MQSEKLKATSDNFAKHWPVFSERLMKKLTRKLMPEEELASLKLLFEKEKGGALCQMFPLTI